MPVQTQEARLILAIEALALPLIALLKKKKMESLRCGISDSAHVLMLRNNGRRNYPALSA